MGQAVVSNHPKANFSSPFSETSRNLGKNHISHCSAASPSQGCSVAPPKSCCSLQQPLNPGTHTGALHFICWEVILLLMKSPYLMGGVSLGGGPAHTFEPRVFLPTPLMQILCIPEGSNSSGMPEPKSCRLEISHTHPKLQTQPDHRAARPGG